MPWRYLGAFRRVYPGFVQLAAFMSMNIERHMKAHRELYDHLVKGEHEKAQVTKAFYDEYFAVLDLTAEFYLETVRLVFQECALPTGKLQWQGERVEPRAIKRTMLLTVEGERDDICAVGQTAAAHELCSGLRPYLKRHHMQAGVGHYGVFGQSLDPSNLSVAQKRHSGKRVSLERISLSGAHAWDRRHQPISQYARCGPLRYFALRVPYGGRVFRGALRGPLLAAHAGNKRHDRPR